MRALLVVPLLLAGCALPNDSGDDVPITPRAVGAIMLQYLPTTPETAYDAAEPGFIGATLRFGTERRPEALEVTVGPIDDERAALLPSICPNCDITEVDEDTTILISRGDRLPEATTDLGTVDFVRIQLIRPGETVVAVYEGRPLRVSGLAERGRLDVETLVRLVQDPALGLDTLRSYVDSGADLTMWTDERP